MARLQGCICCWILLAASAALGAAGGGARKEPGPAACHPDCFKNGGTCLEDVGCRCPFGKQGDACEDDFLRPCRQFEGGEALCGPAFAKSCECFKRCREWFCVPDSNGKELCSGPIPPPRNCFVREGVPPADQFSRFPEPEEKNLKCYSTWREEDADRKEVPCSEVAAWNKDLSLPISKCPDQCNKRGHCMSWTDQPAGHAMCRCHRGYEGFACEVKASSCLNDCNGRGECVDSFCYCKPPYFGLDCSRSTVFPENFSFPGPADFKIYMYEIPTRLTFDNKHFAGWVRHDMIYAAYYHFMEQFLTSSVRTEDPSKAHLFYIPDFVFSYTGNGGGGADHFISLIDYVRTKYPYYNRTNGKDHFLWSVTDRGACNFIQDSQNLIKIVHFGYHTTPDRFNKYIGHMGHKSYGCTHPLRDVASVPYDPIDKAWITNTLNYTLDELMAQKEGYLFHAGGVPQNWPDYSGNTRQTLYKAIQEWKDPRFEMAVGGVGMEYQKKMRSSRFCLAALGHGWGNRLLQSMMAGCVPLIVQEHCVQSFEDVLPYEEFSIRMTNEDLPRAREMLLAVTDEQYRSLLAGVLRHLHAFAWNREVGGRAFDYTIASLRRKYMNLKALYISDVYPEPVVPEGAKT